MNVLLIGSGGRESAFAWKLSQSYLLDNLFIAPGNPGTQEYGVNISLDLDNYDEVADFVEKEDIRMVIVGPEKYLVDGMYDELRERCPKLMIIGPSKKGAMLEGSKSFAKEFMAEYRIPTAKYKSFNSGELEEAKKYIDTMNTPIVIKADGLAAGKGVSIVNTKQEAIDEITSMFAGKFGEASSKVVIEEFLQGQEYSVFVLTDGRGFKMLPTAKDYKRVGEGDTGLNTGGMGAVSPVPFIDDELMIKTVVKIVQPTVSGLYQKNIEYKGFIFFGLINVAGEPYVIEYNCRMGDPESEVVFPRLKNDLVELLESVYSVELMEQNVLHHPKSAATVMLTSGGYPEKYKTGYKIHNLDEVKDSLIFHAGTKEDDDGIVTAGGRVLAITSYGSEIGEALKISMKNAEIIDFEGKNYRKDIGFDL